ncbi:MAG: PASTA domain-containing protein [Flavobacteriales bacterium]|nr:PASTA domain-containing protein [Flavobacteriales bacterium]
MDNFSPEDINDQGSATENEKDINSVVELVENQTKLKDNKVLLKNVFCALLTLPFLFFLYLKFLDIYTLHDKHILVPDYSNFHISQLDSISDENNIRYIIIDSVSDLEKPKGIVLNQIPKPNTKVKKKRRIYLTITETNTSVVKFPDVYDLTLRQALRQIELTGLLVGKLEYKSDIATNKILDFNVNGISIFKGQEILKGTTVNLVVGKGLSEEYVFVPDLIGLSRIEAHIVLKTSSLNIGSEFYDENCEDSTLAVIYKQTPTFENDNELKRGSTIDLFLKNPESTLK